MWEPVAFESRVSSLSNPSLTLVHRDALEALVGAPLLVTGLTTASTNADLHALVAIRLGSPPSGAYTLRRTLPNRNSNENAYDVPMDQGLLFKSEQVASLVYICDWHQSLERLPTLPASPPTSFSRYDSSASKVTLDDCFQHFTTEEVLDGSDMWKCPKCDALRRASKRIEVLKAPNVLVLQLKRFKANGSKISTPVEFPRELRDASLGTYDLFAVLRHHGSSIDGGHYDACIASSRSDESWRVFDDSRVSPVALPGANDAASAYVLFYRSKARKPQQAALL